MAADGTPGSLVIEWPSEPGSVLRVLDDHTGLEIAGVVRLLISVTPGGPTRAELISVVGGVATVSRWDVSEMRLGRESGL